MAIETADRVQIIRVFSSRTCARIIRGAELAEGWELGNIVDGNDGKLKLNVEIRNAHVFDESMAPDLFASWRKILEARLERFVGAAAAPRYVLSRLNIIRYGQGGKFVGHRDTAVPGSAIDLGWRRHSLVCSLNDDFEGGSTSFRDCGSAYRPRAGSALLFPPYYFHAGETVTNGTKYIMTTFLSDPDLLPRGA
jgi:predicted 2-oxoglutarate/Fe(II)-dependent dioxygenase YbiX